MKTKLIIITGIVLLIIVIPISLQRQLYAQRNSDNKKHSNIIFLLTDDQRWDALGYAGNDIILTPNMDKLAEKGVYFKNAFVTTPICAASRTRTEILHESL